MEPDFSEPPKTKVSLIRQILVFGLIVVFWIFFYWYEGNVKTPAKPEKQEERMSEKETPSF